MNTGQALTLSGLRNANYKGSFKAALYAPDGGLILLYDQGDGLRLLKADPTASNILAQAQEGAAGDTGVAMASDAAGNVYVAGTSDSGTLHGTAGAAFPSSADASTNSFLAKFDPDLNLVFLTFLGAGRTAAAGVAASADAVFVTGVTYSTAFPVTSGAVEQTPATGVAGNGFVERFDGSGNLGYATFLNGPDGDTSPAGIAVDSADHAYVTGETSAASFSTTVNALQPRMLGTTSGFLTELSTAGDGLVFSTFIPGIGLTGIALDAPSQSLLLTGDVALGQFPLATVAGPVADVPYQSLLRISADGQQVLASVLLVPGSQSLVSAGPNGTAWVAGSLSVPLFPGGTAPWSPLGDSFLLHLSSTGVIDQALRFGGMPLANAAYATLSSSVGPPAVSSDGKTVLLPGTVMATASATRAAGQRFELPVASAPSSLLPASPADLLPAACAGEGQCYGSAGLLSQVSTGASAASLILSTDASPDLVLRNVGSATATNLAISVSGFTDATNCGLSLAPGAQCGIALSGSGPGSASVEAANSPSLTVSLPSNTSTASPLVLDGSELDFGIVNPASSPVLRTVTVANLTGSTQTFVSVADGALSAPPYTLAESSSTCGGSAGTHTVAGNGSCTLTFGLSAAPGATASYPVHTAWTIGSRDIVLTGITQPSPLALSAQEIDFGVHYAGATNTAPRFLYLSNSSEAPIAHTPVTLPAGSAFSVTDNCPSTIEAAGVCQIELTYTQTVAPSADAVTLALDEGLSVLVTGETLPVPASGASAPAAISVMPSAVQFAQSVPVTEISSETQLVTVANTGSSPLMITAGVTAEFVIASGCGTAIVPGATCTLVLQFAPGQPGVRDGLLSLSAGSGTTPVYVALSGSATGLLSTSNGTLNVGQTAVGQPIVAWFQVQPALPQLTVAAGGAGFGVALVPGDGSAHGTLPASAFAPTVSGPCISCWLAVQFVPQSPGTATGSLRLSTVPGGQPYRLTLTGAAYAVSGVVLTPATEDFGTVPVHGVSAPLTFTLANLSSPAASITVQNMTVTGDFEVIANTTGGASCAGALAPTASCYIEISFAPTATGARDGTLTVTTSAGTVSTALTGSAVEDPGLAISPAALTFNHQPGSGATQASVTLTNTSAGLLDIGTPFSSSAAFAVQASSCGTLAPAAMCTISVAFTPGMTIAAGQLSIPVLSDSGAQANTVSYSVPLAGNYTSANTGLLLLPAQADFAPQTTGALGQTREFTLTNTSSTAETVSLNVPQQFPLAAPFGCGTLSPGASCTFSIGFLPAAGGAATGSLIASAVTASGGTAEAISYLEGYGQGSGAISIGTSASAGTALVAGTPLQFGQISSGSVATQVVTLTNSGSGPLNVLRIVSAPPFLPTTNCGQRALAPGASCQVTVTYAPLYELSTDTTTTAPRPDTGTLVIESDAASSPDEIALAGSVVPSSGTTAAISAASYSLSEGSLTFPNTAVGAVSAAQQVTVLNTGGVALTFGAITSSTAFANTSDCTTVAPGASCTLQITFSPSPQPGSAPSTASSTGILQIQSNASNALEFLSLLGTSSPAPVSLSPSSLDFGGVPLGQSAQLPLTISNTGALPTTRGQFTLAGDYSVSTTDCPAAGSVLAAGQSCTVNISFTPTAAGTRPGGLSLPSGASQTPLTATLTGTGLAPQIEVAPATLDFGSITVRSSSTFQITVTNTGSASANSVQGSLGGANPGDFSLTTACPASLPAGASCTITVGFAPLAAGSRTATLSLTSAAPAGEVTVALSGIGVQPPGLLLTVNGGASGTASVPVGTLASYALLLTPLNGFTGPVALTCVPVTAGPHAACSLIGSQMVITGASQSATANITTIGSITSAWLAPMSLLLAGPLGYRLRRRRPERGRELGRVLGAILLVFGGTAVCIGVASCGGSPGGSLGMAITPPGSYQYQVTASATGGTPVSSSVRLNLIVQP